MKIYYSNARRSSHVRYALKQRTYRTLNEMVAEAKAFVQYGKYQFGPPVTGVKSVSVLPECVDGGSSQPPELTPVTQELIQVVATLQEMEEHQAQVSETQVVPGNMRNGE